MALIYIVEDDVNIREIETFSLKNSGYTVMDFECAKDFYHKLSDKTPDLILLDIMLPDEDGLEILRKLRKNPETSSVKEACEIEQINLACNIGYEMHVAAMKHAWRGQKEQNIAGLSERIAAAYCRLVSFPVSLSQTV